MPRRIQDEIQHYRGGTELLRSFAATVAEPEGKTVAASPGERPGFWSWSAIGVFVVSIVYMVALAMALIDAASSKPIVDWVLAVLEVSILLCTPLLTIRVAVLHLRRSGSRKRYAVYVLIFMGILLAGSLYIVTDVAAAGMRFQSIAGAVYAAALPILSLLLITLLRSLP